MSQERRVELRKNHQQPVLISATLENQNQPVEFTCSSRDISKNGIRLHGKSMFELGVRLNIHVHLDAQSGDYQLLGIVKWVTETTEKEHLAGIQLLPESGTDFQRWQATFAD